DASGVGLAGAGLSDGLSACAAKLPFADLSGRAARKLAGRTAPPTDPKRPLKQCAPCLPSRRRRLGVLKGQRPQGRRRRLRWRMFGLIPLFHTVAPLSHSLRNVMLWIKALHIVFIASWFAGLFYLPRIFVNLAQTQDRAAYDVFLGMARRLFRFLTILAIPSVVLCLLLFMSYGLSIGRSNAV